MFFSTHIYSMLTRMLNWILFVLALIYIGDKGDLNIYFILLILVAIFFVYMQLLRPLSDMLYLLKTLKTRCSYSDAKKLGVLFSPLLSPYWYPMREVLEIPKEDRLVCLFQKVLELQEKKKKHDVAVLFLSKQWKVIRVVLYVVMVGAGALSFFNVGPFALLTELQLRLFNGGYYPVVNILIAMMPIGLLVSALERKLGIPDTK